MADLDTENKRRAGLNPFPGFWLAGPVPDGTIGALDRPVYGGLYAMDHPMSDTLEGVEAILLGVG